jgi:hypothetical protein
VASKLGTWLATLSPDQLAGILARRPDALAAPAPQTLGELAGRLQSRPSVSAALHGLPLPAVQLIEVLGSLGGPAVGRAELAATLGRDPEDPDLEATLRVLAMRALVWPDGPDLRMAGPLWSVFSYPLGLGPPAERLLSARTAQELRLMARALGAPTPSQKKQLVKTLAEVLQDEERVRAAVAGAPPGAGRLLREAAWGGPTVRSPGIIFGYAHSPDPDLDWALSRGLLVADGWQAAVMPAEVGRALRGPDWRPAFNPHPPQPPLSTVDPEAVAREAAAAAHSLVTQLSALLDLCAATPPALLKAGGVGTRELKRLARAVGTEEPAIRLLLELGYAAGLLAIAEQSLLPTEAYDRWRAAEPAERLVPVLRAWWQLPAAPLASRGLAGDPAPAALVRCPYGDALVQLRHELVRAVSELAPGSALAEAEPPTALVRWRTPLLLDGAEDPQDLLGAIWREANRLAVVARGALSPLGPPLVAGEPDRLAAIASMLLPAAVDAGLFQADLSVVVPGTPTARLAGLLDGVAVREARDGAAIWRFSAASVRSALDAGATAEELLAALRAASSTGALPQPLEYLVADVARRHGQVRARAVACVIRADEPALLAEIAAARALASLRLVRLAPTVLASTAPVAETLAALRAAGYAPVRESSDGTAVVERVPARRAPTARRSAPAPRRRRPEQPAPDPGELATALLAGPRPEDEPSAVPAQRRPGAVPADPDDPDSIISAFAPQLSTGEQRLLSYAVSHGTPVEIHYVNAEGSPSARVIEPLGVHGHLVEAWCHLRDEERVFALDRIEAVGPAPG